MMSRLRSFLDKNTVHECGELPAVHTTAAKSLRQIVETKSLIPTNCPVFTGEKLTYLFYGKPSYKVKESTPKIWLMPVCFLIKIQAIPSIKRIFPFDSGAFRAGLHPDYLLAFDLGEFEVNNITDPSKIVGSFFNTVMDYFKLAPKSEQEFCAEHSLSILDSEVKALRDLAADSSLSNIDDRRFCVEIQTQDVIDLTSDCVEAVILPYEYFDDASVINFIVQDLKATPLPYEAYSLSSAAHTAIIYSKVWEFLRFSGRQQ